MVISVWIEYMIENIRNNIIYIVLGINTQYNIDLVFKITTN